MLERFKSCFRCNPQPTLARLLAVGALGCSTLASAVGLGDITLHSSLGQPLNADIELVDAAGLEESDLTANLASADEFARAGVDRIFFLNTLRFTPLFRNGHKVIHVVSSKAVTEPYLNFVVQVNRPGGQLLREFTVLLDPPGTTSLVPALFPTQASGMPRVAANSGPTSTQDAAPAPKAAAPTTGPLPTATQNKRYEVAKGDTLWTIGKRLQAAGTVVPMNQLVRHIRSLNPESVHLAIGQSLLLPDAAVVPGTAPVAPAAATAPVAAAPSEPAATPGQLTATVLENQLLQKDFDALQARLQGLESLVADKDKQVAELKSELAASKAPVPAAVVPAAQAAVAPVVIQPVEEPSDFPWLQVLAAAAVMLLLGALVLVQRRKRQQALANAQWLAEQDDIQPAPVASAVVLGAMAAEVSQSVAASLATSAVRRETPPTTDALDGASIYIAYGRFNEALGILDDGLNKEPERTDLRVRKLEVLGQQGNVEGFEQECQALLGMGFSAAKIDEIRTRYPKLAVAVVVPVVVAAAAEALPENLDEFQLNLDDLSMDADWDLVSPFETPAPVRGKSAADVDVEQEPATVDGAFASNLKELPEVFEMPDEQFLGDFADSDDTFLQADEPVAKNVDGLDDDFLDSFVADSDLPELDALTVDFDAPDSRQESAEKLEQAQSCIELGDLNSAADLLRELLREGDESCKQAARQLLSRIA